MYQWEDKRRTSKWVCVLRQHNICKWLAKRNRKVLSWSSKGLKFFRADIRCERVFLKKLAFLWHHRARCWGRYECVHQEDVSGISITGSLLFPSDGSMFQSEMDLDKHPLTDTCGSGMARATSHACCMPQDSWHCGCAAFLQALPMLCQTAHASQPWCTEAGYL